MNLISSHALLLVLLLFGKGFYGLPMLPKLGTNGKLGMVKDKILGGPMVWNF
jgi:hypothetical protein